MCKRINVLAVLLLMLTITACSKKSTNASENQPPNTNSQPAATNQATPPATAPATPTPAPAPPAESEKTPPPPPAVLPAGTTLTVHVSEAISTKTAKEGDVFTGATASPISVHGEVVIPKGAHVEGVVVQSKSPGKFKGEGTLSVKLTTLTATGTSYRIDTAPQTVTMKGKGKRTAAVAGGSTAGGALIGGLAGGGKGAAIGALVGAGAGAAGAGMTGNKELAIPAESALSFRLQQPLTLESRAETRESAGK